MSQLDFTLFFVHFLDMITVFYIFTCLIFFISIEKSVNDLFRNKNQKG